MNNLPNIKLDAKIEANLTNLFDSLGKTLETAPSGLNKIFTTLFGRRYANNMYHQLMVAAQARYDLNMILTGKARYENGKIIINTNDNELPSLLDIKKEEENENLAKCYKYVLYESLLKEQDKTVKKNNDEKIDSSKRIFNRWRDEAKNISNEEEQALWGRILTEEIYSPGSLSLQTLDIIRNIDSELAKIFMQVCKSVINNNTIFMYFGDGLKENNYTKRVDYSIVSLLENYNIAKQTTMSSNLQKADIPGFKGSGFIYDKYLVLIEKDVTLNITRCTLTKSGQELYNLVKNITEDDAIELCNYILNSDYFDEGDVIKLAKIENNEIKIISKN